MDIETTLEGGYLHVDSKAVKRAGLKSLEILCSRLKGNMTDAEIAEEYKKSGDYDANECKMNVFVDELCICFNFNLIGLDVSFNAHQHIGYGHGLDTDLELCTQVIKSVSKWFSKRGIDEICEDFYKEAEVGVAVQIVRDMVDTNGGKGKK